MSKFAKGSLITAGVLLAVGFVLCLISVIFGGKRILSDREFFGERFQVLDDALDNVNIDIGGGRWFVGWDGEGSSELIINNETISGDGQYQIPADDISNLELSLGAGTFIIEEKDATDGMIDISVRGVGSCDYHVDGNTLYVDGFDNVDARLVHINDAENVITLKVPKDSSFDSTVTEIGAGIMRVSNIDTKDFSVSLGAGEVDLEAMNVDDFSAEIGAGAMNADDMQINHASLSVDVGGCVFSGNISGDMEVECSMGSVELDLDGKQSDHNYDIECSAGNISMEGFSAMVLDGERNIDNGADSTYSISCDMGNVEIEFED